MNSIDARIARILAGGRASPWPSWRSGAFSWSSEGRRPWPDGWPPLDVASLPAGLVALEPAAYLWLGLIVTIATPLVRVAASTWSFGRAGESRMAALGAAVLVVIALAIVAGLAAG